jgi:hypothetical protein
MHRFVLAAPLIAAACASAAEPAAPAIPALDALRVGGTYGFVLDESDPGARLRADCAAKSPGDAAAADACYDAVRQVAAREGIRFSLDPAGRLVWTSYGEVDGRPAPFIEAHLDASLDREGLVAAKLAEPARGLEAQNKPLPPDLVMRFQVVDARTVVMIDPKKGKLVFRRSDPSAP